MCDLWRAEAMAVQLVRQVLHHQAQPGHAHTRPQRYQAAPVFGVWQVLQAAKSP